MGHALPLYDGKQGILNTWQTQSNKLSGATNVKMKTDSCNSAPLSCAAPRGTPQYDTSGDLQHFICSIYHVNAEHTDTGVLLMLHHFIPQLKIFPKSTFPNYVLSFIIQ